MSFELAYAVIGQPAAAQYAAANSLPQAGDMNSGVGYFWAVVAAVIVVAAAGVIIIAKGQRREKK